MTPTTVSIAYGLLATGVIIVFVVILLGGEVRGDMTLDVERIDMKYLKEPWQVQIETSKKSIVFYLYRNRTRPMTAEFKAMELKQPVKINVKSFNADTIDCQMEFTVEDLLKTGRIAEKYEYTPTNFCSIVIKVDWKQNS